MADCFSLPNAAKLVEKFRRTKENGWHGNEYAAQIIILRDLWEAADVIEQLLAENAKLKDDNVFLSQAVDGLALAEKSRTEKIVKLKAERDAAMTDMRYSACCHTCKWFGSNVCDDCAYKDKWEWRGVQND